MGVHCMKVLTTRVIIALSLIFTLACTTRSNKEEYGLDIKDTIRFNIKTEPPSLDWSKSTDSTSAEVEYNIMDGLVLYDIYDPELKLMPGLAEKWEPSKDAKTWTFTIRKGAKWSD